MHPFGELDYLEMVIIAVRIGSGIRDRDGDILPEVVCVRRSQPGQGIDKFPQGGSGIAGTNGSADVGWTPAGLLA